MLLYRRQKAEKQPNLYKEVSTVKTMLSKRLAVSLVMVFMFSFVFAGNVVFKEGVISSGDNVTTSDYLAGKIESTFIQNAPWISGYTETDPLWTGNSSTVARIGDCPSGQFVQNTTTGGVECATPATTNETDPV